MRRAFPILLAALLPAGLLLLLRGARPHYQLEKAVLRPGAVGRPVIHKAYLAAESDAAVGLLRRRLAAYGIALLEVPGGFRAVLTARRGPAARCFAVIADARSSSALAVVDALLHELLGASPRGMTVLLLVHTGVPEVLHPVPPCIFLRDGVALEVEQGAPVLLYLPFAPPGVTYDYELHQGLIATLRSAAFLSVPLRLLAPAAAPGLSAAAVAMSPPRAAHIPLLLRGADCPTLRLRLGADAAPLADLARAGLAVFRLAEGCDRTLESQHYLYLPAGTGAALLKTTTFTLAFVALGAGVLPALTGLFGVDADVCRHSTGMGLAWLLISAAVTAAVHALCRAGCPSPTATVALAATVAVAAQFALVRVLRPQDPAERAWMQLLGRLALGVAALRVTMIHPLLALAQHALTVATSPLDCGWNRPFAVLAVAASLGALFTFEHRLTPLLPLRTLLASPCEPDSPLHYFLSSVLIAHAQYAAFFLTA